MDFLLNPTYWLIAGFLLMTAEMIIPGGIVVFMGAGCLVVSLAVLLGIVSTGVDAITLYFVVTIVLILVLRSFAMKIIGGDFRKDNTIEILDEVGEAADVTETIGPGNNIGRIDFRGTQWPAMGDGSEIQQGNSVTIVARDNVTYIVESVSLRK